MKLISNGVWAGVAYSQSVHDGASCCSMHRRHASPRHKREPLHGGLTTPFRATQHCDQQAGRPCDQQAGRPHCAVGAVETASPSVQTPRTQLWEAMATRWKRRWNRRPAPPKSQRGTCRETLPSPPNGAESATRPPAPHSARPLTAQPPSPPTWELPPSLPHPPVAKTYLPEPTAEDALGSEPRRPRK